jgi:hypothetical protein
MVRKEIACGARQNQVTGCLRDPKKSVPVAGAENENGKTCDDRKNNDHPVLALEAKKGKVLDQKVQRPRAPIFRARRKIKRSGFKNILFLYFHSAMTPRRDLERGGSVGGDVFETGLKTIADAGFGHEKARAVWIAFDFLAQLAHEDAQVLDVVPLIAGPDIL